MQKVKIVAEIGCNHNGDVNLAKKMVESAKACGADAVKFQIFDAMELATKDANKAEYQKKERNESESQQQMLKQLELSKYEYIELCKYAECLGIGCFATAFDISSIDFLAELGQNVWKIPSGEITNLPYLEKIRDIKCGDKEIILSTGMATINEIKMAADILSESKDSKFTILHCTSEYPTNDNEMNLLALVELKSIFNNWNIGLSDHSIDYVAPLLAIGLGISFLEKHFTLDRDMKGPDHLASVTPKMLTQICMLIRRSEKILGSGVKCATKIELENKKIVRKSIVAKCKIRRGDIFTETNITCKRPGTGISPMKWYDVLGKRAERDFLQDEMITCRCIETCTDDC